jgi:radical SAM protein with 4Fe4S-binding SPASM domain
MKIKNNHLKFEYLRRLFASPKNLLLRKLSLPIKIQSFNFEVTRKCSGRCIYCSIWQEKNPKEISIEELCWGLQPKSLFKSVEIVGITGGEPFLRKDLVDICKTLKDICPNASLGLDTNGLHPKLVQEKIKEIKKINPNLHLGISIDGFKHVNGILRGNQNHSDLAWETADVLLKEGVRFSIGSVVTNLNIDEMLDFRQFCFSVKKVPHSVMSANLSEFFYSNIDKKDKIQKLHIPKSEYSLFKKICLSGHVTPFDYYSPRYLIEKRQILPCFSCFNSFFLNSNGEVYPCIHLNKPLGNIKINTFGDLWRGQKAKNIRKSIVKKECHCFTRCEVQSWFRANMFPIIRFAIDKINIKEKFNENRN